MGLDITPTIALVWLILSSNLNGIRFLKELSYCQRPTCFGTVEAEIWCIFWAVQEMQHY